MTGLAYDFLLSYLSDRQQRVVIDGEPSTELPVLASVPQGSRLGPLLFIIYINDILVDLECDGLLFADDTALVAVGSDPSITAAAINRDLEKISIWAAKWKVTFNASKSKDMIFSNNKVLNNSPPLIFNDTYVSRVSTHTHLGVYLTSSLNWSKHIHETCLNANRKRQISTQKHSRSTL